MIKKYLIAGLLFWLPVWITLLVIKFILNMMDRSLAMFPA